MQVLAVILARGGSKGIPRKNLQVVGGVPLVGRSVRVARACPRIQDVVVSTDDVEIADVARHFGADIVERPAELAGDRVSSALALDHALGVWSAQTGRDFDLVLLVQNTSPFQNAAVMAAVVDSLADDHYNSCITVTESYRYFWFPGPSGWTMPHQHRGRRQDRKPWYEEAGSVYGVRVAIFRATGNLFPSPVGAVVVPWWQAFDIDEPEDLRMAEALAQAFHA
jgi:CMP-N-acetylneuraminic acid synthetase